ncbi:M48 family metallopeptidase [Methylobacterium oryzae CBMB20]
MTLDPRSGAPDTTPIEVEGRYFDGVTARPHPVTLRLDDRFRVSGPDVARDWNLLDLRAAVSVPPLMRIGPAGEAARVEFSDATLAAALAARCLDLHRREGSGGTVRLVLWSLAAGLSVLLVAVFGVPRIAGLLAPLVPEAAEARLGAVAEPQILRDPRRPASLRGTGRTRDPRQSRHPPRRGRSGGGITASGTGRERAPARDGQRLRPAGARVIVLSSLIARARSADEAAAVLAHELGHVRRRDPTRSLIRASGTSFLLSLVLGDLTGSTIIIALGDALLSAGYSRDAERAADSYAVDLMTRAGGNGAALADILERIAKDKHGGKSEVLDLLRSHPFTRERAAAIRAQAGPAAAERQIMSGGAWTALRGICGPSATTAAP